MYSQQSRWCVSKATTILLKGRPYAPGENKPSRRDPESKTMGLASHNEAKTAHWVSLTGCRLFRRLLTVNSWKPLKEKATSSSKKSPFRSIPASTAGIGVGGGSGVLLPPWCPWSHPGRNCSGRTVGAAQEADWSSAARRRKRGRPRARLLAFLFLGQSRGRGFALLMLMLPASLTYFF